MGWKQLCGAGNHRWRAKEHPACEVEPTPHWHVSCRRCPVWWAELQLFEAAKYAGASAWRSLSGRGVSHSSGSVHDRPPTAYE